MIVCRTPYRISLFGGGTDFPAWYQEHGGAVLATSIDKYCSLTVRYLPPFFEHKIRVVWSKIENCKNIDEVSHPAVKAVVKYLGLDRCLEIHHVGDLPARSGMGSSSAFTVGLLNSLSALQGKMLTKAQLSKEAIFLEQELLKETVGSQDQVSAAYGGLNVIRFHPSSEISVHPVTIPQARLEHLQSHLMLFYTGIARTSSEVSQGFIQDMSSRKRQLRIMKDLVDEAVTILNGERDLSLFGELLRESWEAKRSLSSSVSNPLVDEMFDAAYRAGALGGKLTGAGGGGFLLLFVPPEDRKKVRVAMKKLLHVPFKFEFSGSQIIFADSDTDYSDIERAQKLVQIEPFRDLAEVISEIGQSAGSSVKRLER